MGDSKQAEDGTLLEGKRVGVDHLTELERYTGPNPFVSGTPAGCWEYFKFAFFTVTFLAPLRVFLVVLVILFTYPFTLCATVGRPVQSKMPMSCCRRVFVYPVRALLRIAMWFLGYYWIPMRNLNPKGHKRTANTLVANHTSLVDALPLMIYYGCAAAAKKEVFNAPLIGRLLRAFEGIPIDRTSAQGRKKALRDLQERAKDTRFPPLLIFPEGTVSAFTVLTSFKKGPFLGGHPLQPVAIRFPRSKNFDQLLSGGLYTLYRTCCQFYNTIAYDFLPEFTPSSELANDPAMFADAVRMELAHHLRVGITQHSFDDVRLLHKASKRGIKVDFELSKINKLFGRTRIEDILSLVEQFRKIDKDNNGRITLEELSAASKLDSVPSALFNLLDNDGDGTMNFGDFVVSLCVFGGKCSPSDSAKALFAIMDLDGDGMVSRSEFEKVLNKANNQPFPETNQIFVRKKSRLVLGVEEAVRVAVGPESVAPLGAPLLLGENKAGNPNEKQLSSGVPNLLRSVSLFDLKTQSHSAVAFFFSDTNKLSREQLEAKAVENPKLASQLLDVFLQSSS